MDEVRVAGGWRQDTGGTVGRQGLAVPAGAAGGTGSDIQAEDKGGGAAGEDGECGV